MSDVPTKDAQDEQTIPIQEAINKSAADASVAALVHIVALETTLAALLEFTARRDGVEVIEAVRERAHRLTESMLARTDNPVLKENRAKIARRVDTLAEVPAALAQAN